MYYFIINPVSGSGRGFLIWKTVQDELNRLGISYRSYLLSHPDEARKLASGFATKKTPCTIVAIGGDGTINDILNGLTSFSNITFACIPTGSGNDFVRSLNLPNDPIAALHCILNPKEVRKINIGCTRVTQKDGEADYLFAVSSGIGFDAAVCDSVQRSGLKKILNHFHAGKIIYLFHAVRIVLTMKRGTLQVTLDDGTCQTYPNCYLAAAMNLPYEGGGFYFCPDAQPDDDFFDLIVASQISIPRVFTLLPQALFGKHVGKNGVSILRCRQASLITSQSSCVHTDGNIIGFHEQIHISLKEEKLPVIIR